MYTVVIADDEEEIRRSLIRKIEWEKLGFQIVGEAANGEDALELVRNIIGPLVDRCKNAIYIGN